MFIQHAPSIPPLVPDERAIRVFTMLGQRVYAILLGHLHLLTTFCLFGSAGCAAVREDEQSSCRGNQGHCGCSSASAIVSAMFCQHHVCKLGPVGKHDARHTKVKHVSSN